MTSLLITNGHLATLDDANRFVENGSIYIDGTTRLSTVGHLDSGCVFGPDRID